MKSTHSLFCTLPLFIIIAAHANAQSWCPPGAVWHHNYATVSAPLEGVVRTECIGDTVIQGETAKLMHVTASGYDWLLGGTFQSDLGFVITKANADQVSFWDGSDWFLLYDLGLPVGGQWLLVCYLDAFVLTVTATGLKLVDGVPLRYSVVSLDPPLPWLASDTVIERVGFKSIYVHPYNYFNSWSVWVSRELRCYEDNEIAYSALQQGACDYTLGVPEDLHGGTLTIMPNPGTDGFSLMLNGVSLNGNVFVLDALGRAVGSAPITQGHARFDARELPTGVFVYRATDLDGRMRATGRWVKE
ncbi:MAG TPA: T9SS type A sorting domain-containing protein [Flavobacteriales bacterium]|nr:T9SS type A sorting domain-containing protein [Flavobacteriales bacterium]